MLKILIITFAFPPLNRIASSRPYAWAKYWSRLGHDVAVLTKSKTTYDGALNFEINREEIKDVRIIELKAWPFRLKRPAPETADLQKKNSNFSIAAGLSDYLQAVRAMGSRDFWGLPVLKKLDLLHQSFPFEVVISSFGPPGGHIIASLLKKKLNIFWVADYRDLWHGNHFRPKKWPLNNLEDRLERLFVKRADLITTVSQGMNKKLTKRFSSKVVTIENGFDEDSLPTSNKSMFPDDGKIRICYTGTIYEGYQDPSPFLQALTLLKEKGFPVDQNIEVLFYGSRLGNLEDLINQYDLKNVVKTPGFINRQKCLQVQRSADALLFLEWEGHPEEGILTGKLFEYLFSGKPILSIGGSLNSESNTLVKECRAGMVLGSSPQLIADALTKIISGQELVESRVEKKIKDYSRENLAIKMIQEIMNEM